MALVFVEIERSLHNCAERKGVTDIDVALERGKGEAPCDGVCTSSLTSQPLAGLGSNRDFVHDVAWKSCLESCLTEVSAELATAVAVSGKVEKCWLSDHLPAIFIAA